MNLRNINCPKMNMNILYKCICYIYIFLSFKSTLHEKYNTCKQTTSPAFKYFSAKKKKKKQSIYYNINNHQRYEKYYVKARFSSVTMRDFKIQLLAWSLRCNYTAFCEYTSQINSDTIPKTTDIIFNFLEVECGITK